MADRNESAAVGPEVSATLGRPNAILIVVGVSGSGKTTVGKALAARLGWPFKEGDDFHPTANIVKMHAGIPLTDTDRWPWLEKVAACIDEWRRAGSNGIVTCSALKRSYRDFLAAGRPEVRFVYLRGDKALIAARLAARKGHFMPADLLGSQIAILEAPSPDERAITVDISSPASAIVAAVVRDLGLASARAIGQWGRQAREAPHHSG